ncbi:Uu.00g135250.m01.CDS01 [Anthostomella pinea]|uniref:Uu.00g135250.m01.CDS01 n=1 Tax=Anthostomella pinea TaxID=933095 RepID=A0AAI8VIN6_9PEZI|nr:Uu.00g135250.m01.CDS01 [Anthostomella pinea]
MWKSLSTLALAGGLLQRCQASYVTSMSLNAQQLFNESMSWMDGWYDRDAGYLYDVDGGAALRHETRSSVWYALGLLARNRDSDVLEAEKIITNVFGSQFTNVSQQWFADYQVYPEQPMVGDAAYPPVIYNSWDPNWRGFIGTTLVMMMEEYSDLLSNATQGLILKSLAAATVGDSYRVGGVDDDNLYPSYSNPAIMRAFVSGWTGRRINDANMTTSGENYAKEIIDLFTRANTLSEFNSGTYTGVSLFGLSLWSKYLPDDSIMSEYGPKMLQGTWSAVAQLWHPGMKNMAGPWDRAYGYDMNRYVSVMALWFSALIGKDKSSLISKPQVMSHAADYAWGPLIAVLADFQASLLPEGTLMNLTAFSGEHVFEAQAYYPPYDKVPRNITTWLSQNLTIGAESFDETEVGGPSESQESFNPAVVQWTTGDDIAFISLWPTETALDVDVSAGKLNLTYPNGNSSSVFTLVVSTFTKMRTLTGWDGVQGLDVNVSGNANTSYSLSFGGEYGGSSSTIRDFEIWNFTYSMDDDFVGTPNLCLELKLWE